MNKVNTKMKCRHKANLLLIPYEDKHLFEEEMQKVRTHLARCSHCCGKLNRGKLEVAWVKTFKMEYPTEKRFKEIFDGALKRVERERRLKSASDE